MDIWGNLDKRGQWKWLEWLQGAEYFQDSPPPNSTRPTSHTLIKGEGIYNDNRGETFARFAMVMWETDTDPNDALKRLAAAHELVPEQLPTGASWYHNPYALIGSVARSADVVECIEAELIIPEIILFEGAAAGPDAIPRNADFAVSLVDGFVHFRSVSHPRRIEITTRQVPSLDAFA